MKNLIIILKKEQSQNNEGGVQWQWNECDGNMV